MSLNNPENPLNNQTVSITERTITEEDAEVLEPENVMSVQKTVVAEANAVLASNRKREPIVTLMPNGIQRIDF